jgi:undecaprenyl-diphosphatase
MLIVDLAVAWARVFIGVHFPLDMLGAAVIAWLACMLIKPLWMATGRFVTQALIAWYRKLLALPIRRGWLRP